MGTHNKKWNQICKPCKKCKGKAKVINASLRWAVVCENCNPEYKFGMPKTDLYYSAAEAVAAWNNKGGAREEKS